MKKLLLGICFFVFAVSCTKKDSNDSTDSRSNTTDVFIKVKIEGNEIKFEGKGGLNQKGCAILSDNNGGFRLVGYDGAQYVNFWISKVPLTSITTTSYIYSQSTSIDWNLNGYNVGTSNEMQGGSLTLTFNKITSGKHSGTFSGTVNIKPGGTTKTIPVTGEFSYVEIVQ
jgi:uncharacterized protein YggL (DUF469 family)